MYRDHFFNLTKWGGFTALILILLAGGCEDFPANPDKAEIQVGAVEIRHVSTEYIEVRIAESGLVADKVNVLTFEIAPHVSAKALEFCGRALMTGPPEKDHVLHFRTDEIHSMMQILNTDFNVVESISPGEVIRLVRPKFPTNEYAPFTGRQGMIRSVEITKVWAVDAEGMRTQISFSEKTP
ncbi:MAG TPA: hypothetical protein ENN17_12145 [bacterium]|nr:hypothetical protein [bacterium]